MKAIYLFLVFNLFNAQLVIGQFTPMATNTTSTVYFPSKIGNKVFFMTRDGDLLFVNDDLQSLSSKSMPYNAGRNILSVDSNRIYLMCSSLGTNNTKIFRSNDTGATWHQIYDTTGFYGQSFVMIDSLSGMITGQFMKKVYTQDAGQNWIFDTTAISSVSLVNHLKDSILFAITTVSIMKSENGGKNWRAGPVPNANYIYPIQVISEDTIYCVSEASGGNLFSYTFKGIDSFKSIYTPLYQQCTHLYALSPDEIYLMGVDTINGELYHFLFKTTDLGLSYQRYNTNYKRDPGQNDRILGVIFANDSIGFLAGENGILLRFNKHELVPTGIEDRERISKLTIYPNPVQNVYTIEYTSAKKESITLEVQDALGKRIEKVSFPARVGMNTIPLHAHALASGMYFVTLSNSASKLSMKFTKH